ncbi:hypothetical protein [Natrarchaeobius oligotrophus]|uniref:Uncharacterized protein n=1 Tax=Natrarchaeobius chitinivorans TaxID=1679083 RepID=A0A3N6MM71_NATCH|nr:hypothetical protein [Natrarchaeobius chitinivorans]RQH02635.1 hypothetical protein EA472_04890 [Natrarchaeobius chitinivorans]
MTQSDDERLYSSIDLRTMLFWAIGILLGVSAAQVVFGGSPTRTIFAAVSAIVILFGYSLVKELR